MRKHDKEFWTNPDTGERIYLYREENNKEEQMEKYKLYVDMVDTSRIALANEPAGHRIVEIELTPWQVALIKPRRTGKSGKTDYYEEIHPVSIQEI